MTTRTAATQAARPAAPARPHRARTAASRAAFTVLIALFVIASLFPFYWVAITSLKPQADLNQGTTGLFPRHLTAASYTAILTGASSGGINFARTLANSAIVAVAVTVITVTAATLAGYGLSRTGIRFKTPILGFILVTGFFPVIAMAGPLFTAYRTLHLLNSYPALIIAYLIYTLPLATWFLASYLTQIPAALEEAAITDGATRLQALRRVIVPVAAPGIFTAAILSFILAWNDFAFAVSFQQTPDKYTAPLAIAALGQSQYHVFYNKIDAAVVTVTIPVALIVITAQRKIITGLTAGALK